MALSPETQARVQAMATAEVGAGLAVEGYTNLYFANLMAGQREEAEKNRQLALSAFERKLDLKAAAIELVRQAMKNGEL